MRSRLHQPRLDLRCWIALFSALFLCLMTGCGGGGAGTGTGTGSGGAATGGAAGGSGTGGSGAGGGGTSPTTQNQAPVVSSPSIADSSGSSIDTLPIGGGAVTIQATVIDPEGDALSVVAEVVDSNSVAQLVTLTSSGGGVYTGVFNAPANNSSNGEALSYVVVVRATDAVFNTSSAFAGSFVVPAGQQPPPPPPPNEL